MSLMYTIAVDPLHPSIDSGQMRDLLKSSPVFTSWWHHIPGCVLVTSDHDANRITDELRRVTGDARLLVMETNPANYEGWLAPKSWEWIKRRDAQHVG